MKVVPEGTVNDGKISAFCENKVTAQRKKMFDSILQIVLISFKRNKKPDTLFLDNIQLIL